MSSNDNEEELLRSVALQNARAILLARERAEKSLLEAKGDLERKNEELSEQREQFRVTLFSIGDGVITTDTQGILTFLNPVAESLTGWTSEEAVGLPLEKVFVIINEKSRQPVENPIRAALRDGMALSLANHTVLVRKNGSEIPIEDSAAPIRTADGKVSGAVMVFHDVGERREQDEALRRSEQFSRSIIESSRDCIKVLDLNGDLLSISGNGLQMLGIADPARYLHKPWLDFWDGEPREAAAAALQSARQGGSGTFVGFLEASDGTLKWWDIHVTPILGANGRPERLLVISRDVTELRQDEERLRRLASVIESSDDAILSMTLETIIATWNKGAERLYGYTSEEMIGKSVTILIPPNRIDEEPEILERLKKGERIDHYETVRCTKSGAMVHVSLTVSPIVDSAGKIVGVSKISRDITQRRRDEEAIRRSEEDLRTLADSIPQLAWMARPDGHVFWYNRRWFEYTGTTWEQMEGWGWQAIHDPKILPRVMERWEDSISSGKPFRMEFPLRGADGQFRWFLTQVNALRDGEGRVVRWFGTNTDVDEVRRAQEALRATAMDNARLYDAAQKEVAERKRAEEALQLAQQELSRYAEDLEKKVSERTAQLREKMGELETFSYSVSHDLRAPLRAIQSFALILEEERSVPASPHEKEYLRRIASAAERMDRLIKDVLNYSRISQTTMSPETVDLGNLVRGVVESYPAFQSYSADIELVGPFPEVLAVEAVLTQCVSNILSNAVKFVATGVKPKVRVWTETTQGGDKVRVFFKDNGLGIPARAHQKIFGIFERVNNDYEGTGIGLSIVKKGVERMGGAVGLESEPGKGSTFWLELKRPGLKKT
jgi:PAS domain S-box-containing protein